MEQIITCSQDTLREMFEDDKQVEVFARRYIELQEFRRVAGEIGADPRAFDLLFAEYPEAEEKFNAALGQCSMNMVRRTLFSEITRVVMSISDIACRRDSETLADPGMATKLKACGIMVQLASKAGVVSPEMGETETDDIGKIWKELEQESKKRKSSAHYQ